MLRFLCGAALLVVVAAGCGDAAPQTTGAERLPRALAHQWEMQASEIATAADAGKECRAMHLAASLKTEVAAARHEVPVRLRAPLLTGVNALAARVSTCTRVVTVPVQPTTPKEPKPKPEPKHHGGHGHGKHGGEGGDG